MSINKKRMHEIAKSIYTANGINDGEAEGLASATVLDLSSKPEVKPKLEEVCPNNLFSAIKKRMEDKDSLIDHTDYEAVEEQNVIPAAEEFEEEDGTPKGALIFEGSETASGDLKSDMSQQPKGPVINLGTGLPIVPEEINDGFAREFDPSNPARAYLQQNPSSPVQVQPTMVPVELIPQQQSIPMQQPYVTPMNMVPPVAPVMPQQKPIHKVDETPKPKADPPKADNVQVELDKVNMVDSFVKQPPQPVVPTIVSHKIESPVVSNDQEIKMNAFDNREIIAKFDGKIPLSTIEEIANKNLCNVVFEEFPNPDMGLILVITTDQNGKLASPKCFTIDSGMIIDKRVKIFAGCPKIDPNTILETCKVWELYNIDARTHKKNIDEKILNDIFYAGLMNVSKREMYTEDYKMLNLKLALITLPTKGLNKEQRNSLQDYIVKMDKDGYLDKARELSPGCRFAFMNKTLDKDHLSRFTLVNETVPPFYGATRIPVVPIIIDSIDGKISIRMNGDKPVSPDQPASYQPIIQITDPNLI